jgi:hypothetical protein
METGIRLGFLYLIRLGQRLTARLASTRNSLTPSSQHVETRRQLCVKSHPPGGCVPLDTIGEIGHQFATVVEQRETVAEILVTFRNQGANEQEEGCQGTLLRPTPRSNDGSIWKQGLSALDALSTYRQRAAHRASA